MPPQKPTALGALKKRPYTPRPVATPQNGADIDALLADSKAFLGEMPEGTGSKDNVSRLNALLADMDAGEVSREQMMAERKPKVGAFGAIADSAATPIRVLSGFAAAPGAMIGEGIAQGLESLAYLDGKPLPAGGSFGKDVTKSLGKIGVAGVFGKLGQGVGPLSALAQRTGTSLAAKMGVGAAAGAAEGVGLNVAQGGLTRAFDSGSIEAAFDKDGALLDAGLGGGIGAAGGAALGAMGALAARTPTRTRAEGPMPAATRAPWQDAADEGFQRNQANPGNVRGPAPRSRNPPPGLTGYGNTPPVGPSPQRLIPGVGETGINFEMPPSTPPPTGPEVGTQAVTPPVQGSPRYDVLDPANPYQGPAGDPTAMPPGIPEPSYLDYPPTAEELASLGAADPVFPAPTGPEVPRGRFPAGSAMDQAAEPFVMPTRTFPAIDEARRIAVLETPPTAEELQAFAVREMGDPSADVAMTSEVIPGGPMDFDAPVPKGAGGKSNMGKPTRVRGQADKVFVSFDELPGVEIPFTREQFRTEFPQLAGLEPPPSAATRGPERLSITPRPGRPTPEMRAQPSAMDDPNTAALLEALRAERVSLNEQQGLRGMEEVSPGVIAEPGTTFAPDPTPPLNIGADETADFSIDDLEAMLRQADEQDAVATPVSPENTGARAADQPTVEVLDPDAATTQNNASGESGASTEAINRQRSLAAQGRTRVMLDRAGRETPIISADGVDVQPQRGQTHAIRNADGSYEVVQDNGGKVPANPVAKPEVAPEGLNAAEPRDAIEEVFDIGDTTPAPVAAPVAEPTMPTTGLTLNDGDQPGTMNQAGKFVPIADDSWRTLDVAKNKSVVIRRADGTVTMVRDNGGKVPKKWDAEKWGVKQEQQTAKAAARAEREAAQAAKKAAAAPPPQAAATEVPVAPSPEVAPPPVGEASPVPVAAAPVQPRAINKTKFGDRDAVEMAFDTAPEANVRKALGEYGFRYFARERKWAFNIPKGSKLTPDEVESAVQAILRGEDVESVQKAINLDAGQQKAAANAVTEGRWAPEPTATVLRDRDLSPDSAERESRRTALRQLGWTPGKDGDRRIWTKPADGMRGDMGLRDPEVPSANPPRAEAPSALSAIETPTPTAAAAATSSTDGSTTTQAKGSEDYEKIDPLDIKVDAKGYQFKGDTDARGRSEKLKGVEEWDEEQAIVSPVLLHRRLDGSLYVVDGHQRVGLAQDLKRAGKNVPDLNARVLDEADGVTVERARRRGAMSNVMLNTADPRDIARVLREGDLSPLEQKRIGRIQKDAGEKFRQGRDLAKLSDKAFDYYLNADIEPRFARMVSAYREELHEGLLQQLDRHTPKTNSEAEAILAQAAELKSGGVQTDMFGNTTVDDSFKELVSFKERVLSTFRTNRRLFGKAGSAADTLESAGQTKIDREAAGKVATAAGRAEELWSKFSNAQGSYTRKAIQEAFDDYKAGRLSFGKATERIAEALDADYTGQPPSGPSGGSGDGLDRAGRGAEGGEGDDATGALFDAQPGGLFDTGAVEAGGQDGGALDDAADAVMDAARRLFQDESGSLNVGDGMAGLQGLYEKNPRVFWGALRAGGGAFLGGLTHDDEDASILDNVLLGAVAGAASPRFTGASWRALKKAAPIVHREVREALTGRVYGRGPINPRAVPLARKPPDTTKDISGFARTFWSPDKVVPDVWGHVQPIMRSLYELEAPARGLSGDQLALARRAQVSEAMSYMRGEVTRNLDVGHRKRAEYIEGLMADLTGNPTVPEQFLSDMTNGTVKPGQVRKVMTHSTNAIYHTLLGWNVASGLANMTQVAFNYPVLGAKATAKGIIQGYSKQGRADLAFLNLNRRPMGHSEEVTMHKWGEAYLNWAQTPMRFSDSGNRRATYAGAMEYATSRGFAKDQATKFADELVGQTQGIAGDLGSNPFHRHLGPLKVFTKYPLIWGSMVQDFATHPDPAVKRRFYGMMTGIFAASALSGVQLANFFIPRAGIVPGVGASVDIATHLFGSPDHDFEEHFELGGTEDAVVPGYINKVMKAGDRLNADGLGDRNIIGRKGQVLRKVSAAEDLGSLLGIETMDRSDARKEESGMYDMATETKREESIRSRRIRREAGEKLEAGDRVGASRALKALSQRQRNEFKKERVRTARERARRLVPLRRREEFDAEFPGER